MEDLKTGGPAGAPRSVVRRTLRALLAAAVVIAIVGGLSLGAAGLPRGTDAGSLIARGMVGLAIGLVLLLFVRRMMRAFGDAPPPPPETVDARAIDVVYVCPVCGTRVRLELAGTAKAPKHCGEEMEATVVGR